MSIYLPTYILNFTLVSCQNCIDSFLASVRKNQSFPIPFIEKKLRQSFLSIRPTLMRPKFRIQEMCFWADFGFPESKNKQETILWGLNRSDFQNYFVFTPTCLRRAPACCPKSYRPLEVINNVNFLGVSTFQPKPRFPEFRISDF